MKIKKWMGGIGAGLVNGLLGAGGGMIAVPYLRSRGVETRSAHATSVALIAPMSLLSAVLYLYGGKVSLGDALIYLPAGAVGAFIGALLLKKISPSLLRRIFGAFAVWAGVRLLTK